MNAFMRIILGAVVAAPAGFLAALGAILCCQALGVGPHHGNALGHNGAEAALGDLLVLIGIVVVAPLFGAVGGATGRPIMAAIVGSLLALIVVIWMSGGWEMARSEFHLIVTAMASWAAGGGAGGFVGYYSRPKTVIASGRIDVVQQGDRQLLAIQVIRIEVYDGNEAERLTAQVHHGR